MERFVIVNHNGEVSVLDTGHDLVESEGNLELFSLDFGNEADADCVAEELDGLVRVLNEQDRLLNL